MARIHWVRQILHGYLLIFLVISGCGGGSHNAETTPEEIEDSASDYIPYYVTIRLNSVEAVVGLGVEDKNGKRFIADSVAAGSFGDRDGFLRSVANFRGGDYNEASYTIRGIHAHSLLYVKKGAFRRLKLSGVHNPQPVQVSSESEADQVCTWGGGNDYAEPDNSAYLYQLAAGGDCSTPGPLKMIRLSTPAGEAPVVAEGVRYVVEPVHDNATGALTGWLAVDVSGVLRQYVVDFSSSISILANVNDVWMLTRDPDKLFWLRIDGSLYRFDSAVAALTQETPFYMPPSSAFIESWISDGENLFFAENAYNGDLPVSGTLKKMGLDGTEPVTVAVVENNFIDALYVTANRLAFSEGGRDGYGGVLTSVARSAADTSTVRPLCSATEDEWISYTAPMGKDVYIQKVTPAGNRVYRLAETDTQCTGATADRRIAGIIYAQDLVVAEEGRPISSVILEEYEAATNSSVLRAYSQSTDPVELGMLPSAVPFDKVRFFEAWDHDVGLFTANNGSDDDVYFYDVRKKGSLKPVAADVTVHERIIDF